MAFEMNAVYLGDRTAAANYSSAVAIGCAVTSTSNTSFKRVAADGGTVLGVLVDNPSSGAMGRIQVFGVAKCRVRSTAHVAIAVMDKIKASSAGYFLSSTATTQVAKYVFGRALDTLAANTTGFISVLITHQGAGSSGAASAA